MDWLNDTLTRLLFGEVSIPDPSEFIWLLNQCSRICNKICLNLAGSVLELFGHDKHDLFAVTVRMPQIVLRDRTRKASHRLVFDSTQLSMASKLLSGSSDLRLRFYADRVEFMVSKSGEIRYTAIGSDVEDLSFSIPRYSRKANASAEAILTLCKAGSLYSDQVQLVIKGKHLSLFGHDTPTTPIVTVRLQGRGNTGPTKIEAPGSYFARISGFVRRAKVEILKLSFKEESPLLFSFRFSNMGQVKLLVGKRGGKDHLHNLQRPPGNLPEFDGSPVVKLIMFVGIKGEGLDVAHLKKIGLDTAEH